MSIIVDLKRFDKTDLERELEKAFGSGPRTIIDDVIKTYNQAINKHGTLDVSIQTDLLKPQVYKTGPYNIKIIN